MDAKTFTNTIAERIGRDPQDVEVLLRSLGEIIATSMKDGDSVAVPGFGTFEPKMRMERESTHPSTGKRILIPPKLSVSFKASALLKQKVWEL